MDERDLKLNRIIGTDTGVLESSRVLGNSLSHEPTEGPFSAYLGEAFCRPLRQIVEYCQQLLNHQLAQIDQIELIEQSQLDYAGAIGKIIELTNQMIATVTELFAGSVLLSPPPEHAVMSIVNGCLSVGHQLQSRFFAVFNHCDALLDEVEAGTSSLSPDERAQRFTFLRQIYRTAQQHWHLIGEITRLVQIHTNDNLALVDETILTTIEELLAPPVADSPAPVTATILIFAETELPLLTQRLARQGYRIISCGDLTQALDIAWRENAELILLEAKPVHHQLLSRFHNDHKLCDIPVIMVVTDDRDLPQIDSFITAGALDYLPKDCPPLILRRRIGESLEGRRRRSREVEFLRTITRFTAAAFAVQTGDFDIVPLVAFAKRNDELGRLAQVFQSMARVVAQRETDFEAMIRARTAQLDDTVKRLNETVGQLETARESAEASEKRALDASQAKSIFLANMSHELRTPLNAILGFVQLMERSRERDREDREYLGTIMRSGEHLLGLINDILALTKIETERVVLNKQTFDLHRLLQGLIEMVRVSTNAKGLSLIFEADEKLPQYVWGDEAKLRQILINILSNAVKFTTNGMVRLRIGWQEETAHFQIDDTGLGIGDSEMSRLFEPFAYSPNVYPENTGRGMGLAVSRKYINLMGGEIEVKSEVGRGTSFSFAIKLLVSEAAALSHRPHKVIKLRDDQPGYRILVVDDKWENRTLLIKILALVGFEVREAENGKEAVEAWASWRPHLIFMDMRMPVMDGYIATMRIRDYERELRLDESLRYRPVPIIALTAHALEQNRDAIFASGCDDLLPKPFHENELFDKLTKHLGAQFIYEELSSAGAGSSENRVLVSVTIERLSALPGEYLRALNKAITLGDVEAAYRVINKISKHDEQLAVELRSMIKSYDFDEVQQLLEKID